jgi:hypothetical protein
LRDCIKFTHLEFGGVMAVPVAGLAFLVGMLLGGAAVALWDKATKPKTETPQPPPPPEE